MSEALLSTKLQIPASSRRRVERSRLLERLDEGLRAGVRLALLSAPAGFGKSTLLCDWIASLPPSTHVGWLSIDEGDNDPSRFLGYVSGALGFCPAPVAEVRPELAQAPVLVPLTRRLVPLVNAVAESLTGPHDERWRRLVLVLDDYHQITAPAIHEAALFLLDHLPLNAHLVIATRADPPLGLPRLRGRGQLLELRQRDLAFSQAEARAFLHDVMALDLPAGEVAALAERTEGWIAGLQMAGLSLQGVRDTAAAVAAFSGSDRYIFDYLVDEVLEHQSAKVQSFLLGTSILERMSGPLCDALLGSSDSAQVLDYLERANLFVEPMDSRREWYRAHRLFRDLMREQLARSQGDRIAELHGRASRWYEAYGLLPDAIHHALQARAWDRAAELVEQAAASTLMRAEFGTFFAWMEALPEKAKHARIHLAPFHLWGLMASGGPLAEIQSHLHEAATRDAAGATSGQLSALRSMLALMRGEAPEAIAQARAALQALPENDHFFRGLVVRSLGGAFLFGGDVAAAQPLFEEDERLSRETGDVTGRLVALRMWAASLTIRGRLRQARQVLALARPLIPRPREALQPAAAKILAVWADLCRECNELDEAERLCDEACEVAQGPLELYGTGAHIVRARIRQARGDRPGSRADIEEALRLALKYDVSQLDDYLVYAYRARLFLAWGDREAAAAWSRERGLDAAFRAGELEGDLTEPSFPYYVREVEYASLARLYLAEDQAERALAVLAPLLESAERLGRVGSAIELLALEALAQQSLGCTAPALGALSRALDLAEPEGYQRIFADEGAPMARLLRLAVDRGIHADYASKLLSALGSPLPRPALRTGAGRLPEPLSEREAQVLRLLAAGLPNAEIADRLVISLETVRSHCRSIYGKLDVHRRWEAADRARELGLL